MRLLVQTTPHLLKLEWGLMSRNTIFIELQKGGLILHDKFESKVAWLPLFPGMSLDVLERVLNWDELRGVVLGTYGTGNAPESNKFKSLLKHAQGRGVIIVNITQCGHGGVQQEMYATSLMLADCGVISGGDMTTEAALIKLMMLLGETDDNEAIRKGILMNLRGERTN